LADRGKGEQDGKHKNEASKYHWGGPEQKESLHALVIKSGKTASGCRSFESKAYSPSLTSAKSFKRKESKKQKKEGE